MHYAVMGKRRSLFAAQLRLLAQKDIYNSRDRAIRAMLRCKHRHTFPALFPFSLSRLSPIRPCFPPLRLQKQTLNHNRASTTTAVADPRATNLAFLLSQYTEQGGDYARA